MTWIRKKDQYNNEECTVALQAKKKKHGWYVDSGCSKHMIGDNDPGGYWWPPAYSTWTHTIVSFVFQFP
jgi:hypothetical protein